MAAEPAPALGPSGNGNSSNSNSNGAQQAVGSRLGALLRALSPDQRTGSGEAAIPTTTATNVKAAIPSTTTTTAATSPAGIVPAGTVTTIGEKLASGKAPGVVTVVEQPMGSEQGTDTSVASRGAEGELIGEKPKQQGSLRRRYV